VEEVSIGRRPVRGGDVRERRLSLYTSDRFLFTEHARLRRSGGDWVLEDLGSRNGTLVNGARTTERRRVLDGDLVEAGHPFSLYRHSVPVPAVAFAHAEAIALGTALATLLPSLAISFEQLAAVAPSRLPVVLRGESGSGKGQVASALHALSG